MNPLLTKLQELGGIYAQVNQSKLKHILILACCILKTRTTCIKKNRDEVASVTGERALKRSSVYNCSYPKKLDSKLRQKNPLNLLS